MTTASIKIRKNFAVLQRFQESFKVKLLQHHDFCVVVKFFFAYSLYFGLYIKGVEQFCPCLMLQIVETPVWLRIEFAEADAPLYRCQPIFMFYINIFCVK